jgi:outer membrane protein W
MNQLKTSMLAATSSILAAVLILLSVDSASASEDKQNYVAPIVGFFNSNTLYGINAKFGIAENVALRPFIQSRSSDTGTGTAYGASVTYNFQMPSSGLIPYLGIGAAGVTTTGTASGNGGVYFEGGIDYNASDNLVINANYKSAASSWINIGAGYRF